MNQKVGGLSPPQVVRFFLSLNLRHFHKNICLRVKNNCCCLCTVNTWNVNFTSKIQNRKVWVTQSVDVPTSSISTISTNSPSIYSYHADISCHTLMWMYLQLIWEHMAHILSDITCKSGSVGQANSSLNIQHFSNIIHSASNSTHSKHRWQIKN